MNKRQRKKLAKRIRLPEIIRRAYRSALEERLTQARGVPFTLAEMDDLQRKLCA